MQQDPRMQELLEAVGPYELQTVEAHGLERLVIVIQGQLMEQPLRQHRLVGQVRGSCVQVWYVEQQQLPRWAFSDEESGSVDWLVFHTWYEANSLW